MSALFQGKLIVKEGCLRVSSGVEDAGVLIIWQTDHSLNDDEGSVEVLDREGQVVARVGDEVSVGGGEVPLTTALERQLREPIPCQRKGPYWRLGDVVVR